MPSNDGKEAERFFEGYWHRLGHVERLRDKRDLMGINNGAKIADFAKPCDFIVSSQSHPLHYAEVKSTHSRDHFPFKDIRPAQHNAALREAKLGAGAYRFYIFSFHLGQWFVMTARHYAGLIDDGRRSVKFQELDPWIH